MFIKIKDVRIKESKWVSQKVIAPIAYIPVSDYELIQLKKKQEENQLLSIWDMSKIIGIVSNEVKKLGYELVFSDFSIIAKEREESLLETLKGYNLAVNDKGHICFDDLEDICFEVDGNVLTYSDFCKYQLPEGKVFKRVYDNGFSYIGSDPFRVTSKEYADAAIKAAGNIGRLWQGWRYGFRLNDIFCIDVSYGKDESYSKVSFS